MFSLSAIKNLFKDDKLFVNLTTNGMLNQQQLDVMAELLKNNPEQIKLFQNIYEEYEKTDESKNLFQQDAAKTIENQEKFLEVSKELDVIIETIVEELLSQSQVWDSEKETMLQLPAPVQYYDTNNSKDLLKLGDFQFTGYLYKVDIKEPSSKILLDIYKEYLKTGDMSYYHRFRQGLDILDLDEMTYELLSYDPNAMSKRLPPIAEQVKEYNFFKIPKTKILKVPMTLLQSTRTATYNELSPISIEIINRYIYRVFGLDDKKDYFIKTGTFSSKFDFRNAKVTAGQEVKELGSYLWYIQHQASQMASIRIFPSLLEGLKIRSKSIYKELLKYDRVKELDLELACQEARVRVKLLNKGYVKLNTQFFCGAKYTSYWDGEYIKVVFTDFKLYDHMLIKPTDDVYVTVVDENTLKFD